MATDVLTFVALLGSGTTAGVLFAVALSMVPALRAMPVDRYVQAHRLLGRNWDPTMPIVVLTTVAALLALAVVVDPVPSRVAFGLGAVLMAAVAGVSHLGNVPLNRSVKSLPAETVPGPDWVDPRPVWGRLHLLRTSLALAAFLLGLVTVLFVQP
ncbi:hypothetical protein AWW66_01215 [Micromonospora rosaria]|uniref:DUF1772 domain-containing protein n=1 Tax=Micromonospora rosaria TaxID=47874 RepID=A0A136PZG0_9ACTN|nr:DUF1772 domain-containing protein [Micromonospora rosaria]KXK63828.1 hypothetical protein AWW66_01215 [Micromonospora rosaria]